MRFTVVFGSGDDGDFSYGLCFVPCPVWEKGTEYILNPHPENPHYCLGDAKELIKIENLEGRITNECLIVIHNVGYGSIKDLEMLKEDLIREGFNVRFCSL